MKIALEKGITFNGEHSYKDYKMILTDRIIGLPNKSKILETVPFSNAEYDFSNIYGAQVYEPRESAYTFTLFSHHDIPDLERQKIVCVNWFMGVNEQVILKDDEIEYYYFLGEVREAPECTFNKTNDTYSITVKFTCYPFKIGELAEGTDLWDPFCFDTDVFQDTKFTVSGSDKVTLVNTGITPVSPAIICSGSMSVLLSGTTYVFSAGTAQSDEFMLSIGENAMTISGNGTIEFVFHKELL